MLITAITHASARDDSFTFRGLSAAGQVECEGAAARYLELIAGRDTPPIERIVSSPKPRCVETALLFAKALLNEHLAAGSMEVADNLKAGAIEGGELAALAAQGTQGHLFVSGHADLAKTLPPTSLLVDGATRNGWFQMRPVLFQIEVGPAQRWEQARLRFCVALSGGDWQNLLRA